MGIIISLSPRRAFAKDIDIMIVPMVRSILLMKQGMVVDNERIQITLDEVPASLKSIHFSCRRKLLNHLIEIVFFKASWDIKVWIF